MLTSIMPARQWAAAVVVAALILAFLSFRVLKEPRPLPSPTALPIVIEIQGEIHHPGRYVLAGPRANLSDALEAAGGLSGQKVQSLPQTALSRPLASGTIARVEPDASGRLAIKVEPMPASTRLMLGIKLDVNEASLEELLCVPRMKPETARAIVERRKERPWRDLQELQEITGVGPRTVERWKLYLSPPSTDPE